MIRSKSILAGILFFTLAILLFYHGEIASEYYLLGLSTIILFLIGLELFDRINWRQRFKKLPKFKYVVPTILISFYAFGSCKSSNTNSTNSDSTNQRTLPKPPDNSDATNPSLADTSYSSKDTTVTHGDSVRKNK